MQKEINLIDFSKKKMLYFKTESTIKKSLLYLKSWIRLLVFIPQEVKGFCQRSSFEKLLFGDCTEGEGKGGARGILLPGHDAVLDGFLYHLQVV